jgi:tetraprenyl-beta-curcumene synthase
VTDVPSLLVQPSRGTVADVAPLSRAQLAAVGGAAARELGWGLRLVRRELTGWRARAELIGDPVLREHAVGSLTRKRTLVDGAAFYWILPERRDADLLRLLVAFQVLADLLDELSERGRDSRELMRAFGDAVVLDQPVGEHDEYTMALIDACRTGCAALPGYPLIRGLLGAQARQAGALGLHHIADVEVRADALRRFAADEFDTSSGATWFEQTAGGASALTIIVLLAMAADPRTTEGDMHAALAVYSPWVSALSMMLDSWVDQHDDRASGHVSFVGYYESRAVAVDRIAFLINRSLRDLASLPGGERHTLITAAMVAMFLSRDSARSNDLAAGTRTMVAAGGPLTRLLLPLLRTWRAAYRLHGG